MTDKKTMQRRDGLISVLCRNQFYADQYKTSVVLFLMLLLLNVVLLGSIVYTMTHPIPPQYIPATNDYKLIRLHPLTDPVLDSKTVLQWASLAAQKAYNLDYVHWRSQLQDSSAQFTDSGWKSFLGSLKSSNNLKSLVNLKLVSSAEITGAPVVDVAMPISGHYGWRIHFPMQVTYTGKKTIKQNMMITLVVLRESVVKYPNRVAINNYIADIRG